MSDSFYKENSTKAVKPKDTQSVKSRVDTNIDDEEDPSERLISDKKLEKQERDSYKNSFLFKLFENVDFAEDKRQTAPKSERKPIIGGKKEGMPYNSDLKAVEMAVNNNATA